MTKTIALLLFLSAPALLFAQQKSHKPFILKGKITGYLKSFAWIAYTDNSGRQYLDTIPINREGDFFYRNKRIVTPVQARFINTSIFIAPGYDLTITGDAKTQHDLLLTKKVSGIGSESNLFLTIIDSMTAVKSGEPDWIEEPEPILLHHLKQKQAERDSVMDAVFNMKSSGDPYFTYFGKLIRFDNICMHVQWLCQYIQMKLRDQKRIEGFMNTNFNRSFLEHTYDNENLQSFTYKQMIADSYLWCLMRIDFSKDSTLRKRRNYDLEKINETFRGKVKDFALYSVLKERFAYTRNINELNENKNTFYAYEQSLQNKELKGDIAKRISAKEKELLALQAGKPAPVFTLEDKEGKKYSLTDFANKVIYIDIWASWCHPCREQTPYLKKIHEKYRNSNDLAIISISIDKNPDEWKEALKEDKPTWLQLLDQNDMVHRAYVANTIPQFVIIDKKGKIVRLDAPLPSTAGELEKILLEEMSK